MFIWLHDLWGLRGKNAAHHAMLTVIEANLIYSPHEWTANQRTATNEARGITIWIANKGYGFHIFDGTSWQRSPEIFLSRAWKKRLWAAWAGRGAAIHATSRARQMIDRFRDDVQSTATVLPFKPRP